MKNEDRQKFENKLDHLERVNELNEISLRDLTSQLVKLRATKAWRLMLLIRRIHEQLLGGNATERRIFLRWCMNKLFSQPVSPDWGLNRYDPLPSVEVHTMSEFPTHSEAYPSHKHFNDHISGQSNGEREHDFEGDRTLYQVGLDVFRFAVIEWDFRWQRPQQLSTRFAAHGHRVFYVSVDTLGLEHSSLSYDDVAKQVVARTLAPNVWGIQLCSCRALNAYRDVIADENDLRYLQWSVQAVRARFGIGTMVSILDLPFWARLAFSMEDNKVVYDCMDDHAGFSTNSREMLTAERQLMQEADFVITSSVRLYDSVSQENQRTALIRNAGEYSHFSNPPQDTSLVLRHLKGPVIGYYGAISEWFDIHLVEQLARKNPGWSFVLVGNTFGCDTSRVAKLNNVMLIGEVPYVELPQYLYSFDVCLIPFLVNRLTLATNPVKVYEYMSAGKPVVSSRLPEVELMSEYVYLATSVEEFQDSIRQALAESDSGEQSERRRAFARANTWDVRYQQLEGELFRRFYPKVSIVIVTFNNWALTSACLSTVLRKSQYPNLEIIVVDNNSMDETRERLAALKDQRLKTIFMPNNSGFAGGNAEGCRASTGDYIILLNNDTMVPEGWVQRLLRVFHEDPEVGMAGPVSNSVGNDQVLDFFVGDKLMGPDPAWLAELYSLYKGKTRDTDLLGFYCVAMRREAYEAVGDLDTMFGIGMFEDDDYCERIRQAGYKLAIVEDAFVYHFGSASFKKLDSGVRDELFEQNKRYFEHKWHKLWTPPKHPTTIFHGAVDVSSIARSVRESELGAIAVLGPRNWNQSYDLWQKIAVELSRHYLVVVSLDTYHGKEFIGTRKLGPNLYITNVIGYFSESQLEAVIYCGDPNTDVKLQAHQAIVDRSAYEDAVLSRLLRNTSGVTVDSLTELSQILHLDDDEKRLSTVRM